MSEVSGTNPAGSNLSDIAASVPFKLPRVPDTCVGCDQVCDWLTAVADAQPPESVKPRPNGLQKELLGELGMLTELCSKGARPDGSCRSYYQPLPPQAVSDVYKIEAAESKRLVRTMPALALLSVGLAVSSFVVLDPFNPANRPGITRESTLPGALTPPAPDIQNGTVKTPIGELEITGLRIEDYSALAEEYLAQNPDAKDVYLGLLTPFVDEEGKSGWYGGYIMPDGTSPDMAAWDALPENTRTWDGPHDTLISGDPNQRLLVQILNQDGTVQTMLLPLNYESSFACGDGRTVLSFGELSSADKQAICAPVNLMWPFQGGEPIRIVVYGGDTRSSSTSPMHRGENYNPASDIERIFPPSGSGEVSDRAAIIHELAHDTFKNLSPRDRANLAAAYQLMSEAGTGYDDPIWEVLKESTYYCSVMNQCDEVAGHPEDREDGDELFASTSAIVSGFPIDALLRNYDAMDPKGKLAIAASVGATLHALYAMSSDTRALDEFAPEWRKLVDRLDADVQSQPDRAALQVFADLHELAVLA